MDARSTYTSVLVTYYAGVAADLPIISPYARALASLPVGTVFSEPAVVQAFLTDPFLCAKLCGAANSMFFNHDHESLYALDESLRCVGFEYASELLREAPELPGGLNEDHVRSYWAHCMSVAHGAKRIAEASTRAQVDADVAYLVGMVHDIGLLLQIHYCPHRVLEVAQMLEAGEASAQEQCHSHHGEQLVRHWSLPALAVSAVKCHHHPNSCKDQSGRWLSRVVALTEMLVETRTVNLADLSHLSGIDDVVGEVGVSCDALTYIRQEVASIHDECLQLVVPPLASASASSPVLLRLIK